MAKAIFWKPGCRAPWSAVLVLAISATLLFACGDVEDTQNPGADAGTDVMSDVSGGDAGMTDVGGSDATPTPDVPSSPDATPDDADATEELPEGFADDVCEICAERGYDECPPFDRILSWVMAKTAATSPEEAADAMCPELEPTTDACTPFEYVLETEVWDCGDGMMFTFEALEERQLPDSDEVACFAVMVDDALPIREENGELVLYNPRSGLAGFYCSPADD